MFGKRKKAKQNKGVKVRSIRNIFKSRQTRKSYRVKCYLTINDQNAKLVEVDVVATTKAKAVQKAKRDVTFKVGRAYLNKKK